LLQGRAGGWQHDVDLRFAVQRHERVEVDQPIDPLGYAFGDAADHHPAVAMACDCRMDFADRAPMLCISHQPEERTIFL